MLYIGYTNDLKRRLKEYNNKMSRSTKGRAPFKLVYYEAYLTKKDAEKREIFFKSGWGKQYIKRSLKYYLISKNLGGCLFAN